MSRILVYIFILFSLPFYAQVTKADIDTKNEKSLWEELPEPEGPVNDFEHLYNPMQEEQLLELIKKFYLETGVQIAIVTINPSQTPKERFEELTLHISKVWGEKDKENGNSILIGISAGYHRMRIQNGTTVIKYLSDDETYDIVQSDFVPLFVEGKYFDGTVKGIKKLLEEIKQKQKKQ